MDNVRIAGVLIGLVLLAYGSYRWKAGEYRRLDFFLVVILSLGVVGISIFPAAGTLLTDLFQLNNRLFAILVFSNLLLFALFLYLLGNVNSNQKIMGELIRALARREFTQIHQAVLNDSEPTISIIIPAYNEEAAIQGVLCRLPNRVMGYKVIPIVVVDGGEDNTEIVARDAGYYVAAHLMNRGQGGALRTGFDLALQLGTDIVVTMDADGQHRPEEIAPLIKPIIAGEADYVMGSRFLGEYEDRGGFRHAGIIFFTILINILGRVNITDCTNGFRAIRGRSLAKLELREDKFNAPELIMEAARKGLRIKEIPVIIKSRAAGASKKPPRLGYPLGFLRTIVQTWLR